MNREAAIVAFSGSTGEGLSEWLSACPRRPAAPLVIDYDRYAVAEAMLGWLNGIAVVRSAEPFSPAGVVRKLFEATHDTPIAHLKVAVLSPGAGAAAPAESSSKSSRASSSAARRRCIAMPVDATTPSHATMMRPPERRSARLLHETSARAPPRASR